MVGDVNQRVAPTALLTDVNVAAALNRASGEVEAACLVAGKYTPTDLNALTGMSQSLLQGLVADLAFWFLMVRRYPGSQPTEAYKGAMEKLERLRLSERIFGLTEVADAGLPVTTFTTQTDIDTLNLNTTISRRFFGVRGKERRLS